MHHSRPAPVLCLGSKFRFTLPPVVFNFLKIIVSLGFIFITSSVVNATSFDCAKASSTVDKLICKQSKINAQDENMAFIYKYALLYGIDSPHLKSTQREWLKRRNKCTDEACLKESYQARIDALITTIDSSNQPSSAPADLKGLWYGGDRASKAIYGTILITDRHIIWGAREFTLRKDPKHLENRCKTNYSFKKEPIGTRIDNGLHRTLVLDEKGQFKTFKIKLTPNKCYPNLAYIRFTFLLAPPFYTTDLIYADVVEYDQNGQTAGITHFHKLR